MMMIRKILFLVALGSLAAFVPSGAAVLEGFDPADECTASTLLDDLTSDPQTGDGAGSTQPTYAACAVVEGVCTITEEAGTSVSGSAFHLVFYARVKVKTTVDIITTVHCEGYADVTVLHWGGAGLRAATTFLGTSSGAAAGSTAGLSGPLQTASAGQQASGCEYLAQYESCRTQHVTPWESTRTYKGQIASSTAGVTVCAPLDVHNSDSAPAVPLVNSVIGPITEGASWSHQVCSVIRAEVHHS